MAFGILNGLRVCGIYMIRNMTNGKFYVGSSVNVESRIFKHLSALRRKVHKNAHLQAAFDHYGEAAFEYVLLEECEPEALLECEQRHINTLCPQYNICAIAGNTLGYRHTDIGRAKMAVVNAGNQRMLGKKHTEATKALIGALARQRTHTPEAKAKISASLKGNQYTAGKTLTNEHKAKVSQASIAMWAEDGRRQAAAARSRARWADPVWKAQQAEKIRAGKAARLAALTNHYGDKPHDSQAA